MLSDPLTGLANHRGFHERLSDELERARHTGLPLALVSIDLDDFRLINDSHGYPYGDDILRLVGAELRSSIRSTDIAARVGGEEFKLILPDAGDARAQAIARRARSGVASISISGAKLSCSAGIAIYPADAGDSSTLEQLADGALMWAKHAGKDRTRRFDADHGPPAWSVKQRAEITELLDNPQSIVPVYQPVVELATGRVVGYEALARFPVALRLVETWFVQAHGCGLGAELEAAAIRAALEPLGRPYGTHLGLNISPSALSSPVVHEVLPRDLDQVVIEITEHEFVADDDALTKVLAELRERGCRIAIDDAGAGYAGLQQLMGLRPDIVKLDRALTQAISTDPARMALVESFVRFAERTGAIVCAEGIESLDDLAILADLDVQWGQGFALARPAPPWTEVSAGAVHTCREALSDALQARATGGRRIFAGDRQLEHLSARLAAARSRRDLEKTLGLVAAELNADEVSLSRWDPEAAVVETLAETGAHTHELEFSLIDYQLTSHVLRDQVAVQVMVSDPDADPAEVELMMDLGQRSLLIVPVVGIGESLGVLEAYSSDERPWTRTEIYRARIIANQFASVIHAFFRATSSE